MKRLKPGQVGLVCDKCGALISDDGGYLCVVDGRAGVKRWRAFHDACNTTPALADCGAKPIVVRSERVATYSMLLTTLADLATDPRIGFAKTAWPALLKRIAFDTDWSQTEGRKTQKELASEHREMVKAAGLIENAGQQETSISEGNS